MRLNKRAAEAFGWWNDQVAEKIDGNKLKFQRWHLTSTLSLADERLAEHTL